MLFHFVERKWWYFLFSALLIVPGVFFLAIGGLRPGIEFKGGTLLEVTFANRPDDTLVKNFFTSHGHDEATIQGVAGGGVEVRTTEMLPAELASTEQGLKETFGSDTRITNSSVVSPSFSAELNPVINYSIMQTLARSVITSLTVVFTLLALFLFGGFSVRNFALALLIGIVSGTYSSIFNASQIISLWQEVEDRVRHRRLAAAT